MKSQFRAVRLLSRQKPLEVQQLDLPKPNSGELLIKVAAAPINPSDLIFIGPKSQSDNLDIQEPHQKENNNINNNSTNDDNGVHSKQLPCVPGWEGSGVVVESGGGIIGWMMKGSRVAFVSDQKNPLGSWGEYIVVPSMQVIPLDKKVSLIQGANSFVNPMTVVSLYDIAATRKAKAVISTAAASQLGRMLQRYFTTNKIKVINIVRRQEQIDLLKQQEKAEYVLNSSSDDFEQQLNNLCNVLDCKLAFDAIGGKTVNMLANNMKVGSEIQVYGLLADQDVQIDNAILLKKDITIKGFLLNHYLMTMNKISQLSVVSKARTMMTKDFKTIINKQFGIDEVMDAIKEYKHNMTKGKCMLVFDKETVQKEKDSGLYQ